MNLGRLKREINRQRKRLGLMHWSFEIAVVENKRALLKKLRKTINFRSSDVLAEVAPRDFSGRKYIIYFTKAAIDRKDLDEIVLHEMLPALFWKVLDQSHDLGASKSEFEQRKLAKDLDHEEHLIIRKLIGALL